MKLYLLDNKSGPVKTGPTRVVDTPLVLYKDVVCSNNVAGSFCSNLRLHACLTMLAFA